MVIRATGVCIHNRSLLLVHQSFKDMGSFWSLPGGKVEEGETIDQAVLREIQEEAGLKVAPERLLYVSQRFTNEKHIVQIFLQVSYVSGTVGQNLSLTETEKVNSVEFIPVADLEKVGISKTFARRVRQGFPDAGKYFGSISDLGL